MKVFHSVFVSENPHITGLLAQMQLATDWNHLMFLFSEWTGWKGRLSLFLPPLVPAKRWGDWLCKVSLCIKCMWTAALPRALQGMITSQGEQLSNSMERLLIFSLSIPPPPPVSFNLLHVIFSPLISHTCGHDKKHVCMHSTCKHKQVNTHKKTEERREDIQCVQAKEVSCVFH